MTETRDPSDHELLDAVRAGDDDAYAELWSRHIDSAVRAARQFDHSGEAEDIAAEAFTRLLVAIRAGRGPTSAFRPYLLRTVTNIAQSSAGQRRQTALTDDDDVLDDVVPDVDPLLVEAEHGFAVSAYQNLRPAYREALWYVDVERLGLTEAARLLGTTPDALRSQAHRARSELRRGYLRAHVATIPPRPGCRRTVDRLPAYVRGELGDRARRQVDAHLEACAECTVARGELADVSSTLRAGLLPLLLAVPLADPATKTLAALAAESGKGLVGAPLSAPGVGLGSLAGGATAAVVVTAGVAATVLAAVAFTGLPFGDDDEAGRLPGSVATSAWPGNDDGRSDDPGAVAATTPAPTPDGTTAADVTSRDGSTDDDRSTGRPAPGDVVPAPNPAAPDEPAAPPAPRAPPSPIASPEPITSPDPTPRPDPTSPPRPPPTAAPPEPTATPTAEPTTSPPPPDEPPAPSELSVTWTEVTDPAWTASPARFVVVTIQALEEVESVKLVADSPRVVLVSPVVGSLPAKPPLRNDDAWQCAGVTWWRFRQECAGDADETGTATAVLGALGRAPVDLAVITADREPLSVRVLGNIDR